VFVNQVDAVQDKEMLELIELEMRELVTQYGFKGKTTTIVFRSALYAIGGRQLEIGIEKIDELLKTIDE